MRIRISLIRFLLEAGFLVLVAAAAGLAELSALWIGVVMFGAWLLVALVERTGARRAGFRRQAEEPPVRESGPVEWDLGESSSPADEPAAEPPVPASGPVEGASGEPDGSPVEAPSGEVEAEDEPEPEPVLVAVPPPLEPELEREAEPEPEPKPEPEPEVVPLVLHDPTPRVWNLWELERLAAEKENGEPARIEERALLLLHLREFANAYGDLPLEFDQLVREAFGADLAELVS